MWVRKVTAKSKQGLRSGKDTAFQWAAGAGFWFMFAVTKMFLFVLSAEVLLLNSGNAISLVVLMRFLLSVGTCKKTFHKASSSLGIMGFESPSEALDVHNICWLYVWSSSLDLLWAKIKEEDHHVRLKEGAWHEILSSHLWWGAVLCPILKWEEQRNSGELQDSRLLRCPYFYCCQKRFISFLRHNAYNRIVYG